MKTKIKVNELTDTTVTAVSLVKHGANRTPFKVVKSDDGKSIGLGERLSDLFRGAKPNEVAAFFVRKGEENTKFAELLKSAGYVNTGKEDGDVVVYEQPGFSETRLNQFLQLNDDVGVALTKADVRTEVVKDFCPYSSDPSSDFQENLNASSFYPGMYRACEALQTTISAVLSDADSPAEAATGIKPALDAFSTYMTDLINAIPVTLFKFENVLSREFGSHNVAATQPSGADMRVKPLTESVPGDLQGLQKNEGEQAAAPAASAEAAPAGGTEEAPAAAAAAAPATETQAEPAAAAASAESAPAGEATAPVVKDEAIAALTASITALTKSVQDSSVATQAAFDALNKRVDAVETLAKSANTVAKSVTVTSTEAAVSLDQSLGLREHGTQRLRKSEKRDLWSGVMDDLPGMSI